VTAACPESHVTECVQNAYPASAAMRNLPERDAQLPGSGITACAILNAQAKGLKRFYRKKRKEFRKRRKDLNTALRTLRSTFAPFVVTIERKKRSVEVE